MMTDKKVLHNTPPVIRVFISSTFADMDRERSYFNEVLAPKISRACSARGVSFFSVDLRWGITEEDQIGGQVLPICLSEIDKCRPYFIGIIGNRYGSILETVPMHISKSIPWLVGKEGLSITELEMLYAVLDHDRDNSSSNSAFYVRSDRLSRDLYGDCETTDKDVLERIARLKGLVAQNEDVLCSEYDSIEEFGDCVMRDLLNWLDKNFPGSDDVRKIRSDWYNGEILRDYISDSSLDGFLNTYISQTRKSLLIYGDGARGKTAYLTAWQPELARKVLVNCGADDEYSYWPSIARQIINALGDVESENPLPNIAQDKELYFTSDESRDEFRTAFKRWLNGIRSAERIVIVISDLNLLEDARSRLLSWLPSESAENVSIICSTNDDEMVDTAQMLDWNIKEMPLFSPEKATVLIKNHLHTYGKKLSDEQLVRLVGSVAAQYPGQLRFIISFLINHARFNKLDAFVDEIASFSEIFDVYKHVYDYLTADYSEREIKAIRSIFGVVHASAISLSERDCFELAQGLHGVNAIEWANVCRVFEQFEIIKGDYWNIRSEEIDKFVDRLLTTDELTLAHSILGDRLLARLDEAELREGAELVRENTSYAKEILSHYRKAEAWDKLISALSNRRILTYLKELDRYCIKSAWLSIFLHSDYDIFEQIKSIALSYKDIDLDIARNVAGLLVDFEYPDDTDELCRALGVRRIYAKSDDSNDYDVDEDFARLYKIISSTMQKGEHRTALSYINNWLSTDTAFSDIQLCLILSMKVNCENNMHLYDESVKTANAYYRAAIRAGLPYQMHQALSVRAEILLRHKRSGEAIEVAKRVQNIALGNGNMRMYLSSQNIISTCLYRIRGYDASIKLTEELCRYWEKLKNTHEVCSNVIIKCNALYLADRDQEAFDTLCAYYEQFRTEHSDDRYIPSMLGNLGLYATSLKRYEDAQRYLLDAVKISKEKHQESSLYNAYSTLISLYTQTDSLAKLSEVYSDFMEFLWKRREYSELISRLKKNINLLLNNKYSLPAKKLEEYWKEKFSTLEGGREYFESQFSKDVVDTVKADKLKQQIIIAKGEGDLLGAVYNYNELATMYESSEPDTAAEYWLEAAELCRRMNDEERFNSCINHALSVEMYNGEWKNEKLGKRILECADSTEIDEIVRLWTSVSGSDDAYTLAMQLIANTERYESMVVSALTNLSLILSKKCTAEQLISLTEQFSEDVRAEVYDSFDSAFAKNMTKDLDDLMHDFLSPEASEMLSYYEKGIIFMEHFKSANACALSGNIALIFRRRKDEEKTIKYHTISMRLFREANKMRDSLIEMLNMSTAYSEFGHIDKALDMLRSALVEAQEVGDEKLSGSIAGNISSLLMKSPDPENKDEIMRCFGIEESSFRKTGILRDLAISLINQAIYLHDKADVSEWKPKVDEAGEIIRSIGFKEMEHTLSQLEWLAAKHTQVQSDVNEDVIRERVSSLLADSEIYALSEIEFENGKYKCVCFPKEPDALGAEQINIYWEGNSPFMIEVRAFFKPTLYKAELLCNFEPYIDWWNSLEHYILKFDEETTVLMAGAISQGKDEAGLKYSFARFLNLWKIDRFTLASVALDSFDLSVCQGFKIQEYNRIE